MYTERKDLLAKVQEKTQSSCLLYVTGDRRGMETQIGSDALSRLVHHLDAIGDVEKISLILYTLGGETLAAWTLINLIRQFCKELTIIVPEKARSAGTLMCLGADRIIMTKQATLGPIDPSVNTALNPVIPGTQSRMPVSVESINAFMDFARNTIGPDGDLSSIFLHLAQQIHPLVLGNASRTRTQIRMLAGKLLNRNGTMADVQKTLEFLCSQSGSHDYTINRREARDELGLPVEKPDDELYGLVNNLYKDFASELELTNQFDPGALAATAPMGTPVPFSFTRALVESVPGGSHRLISEGNILKQRIPTPTGILQEALSDTRTFEGWRHHA